jgi:hypothetical protein
MANPNWAEILTGVGTSVGAVGLLSAIGAAIYAGRQVREAERGRQATMAADFVRRWDEHDLVETRRFVGEFKTPEDLKTALEGFIASNSMQAYVLFRELDYFEQLAALEHLGAFDFELIELMLGRTLLERWEKWQPALNAAHGTGVYPMFDRLAAKMRAALEAPR